MSSPGEPPVIRGRQSFSAMLRGWACCFIFFFSAFYGAICIVTPMLPFIFLGPRLWRKLMDRMIGSWLVMPGALLKLMFGTKVSVKGDLIEHSEPGLILMNHRTSLDWLFFWDALYKMDPWLCTSEKIVMKGALKYLPGAGWAMASNAFIFLDRLFRSDVLKLDSILAYYATIGDNYQILLFPEGTDKCPIGTEKSHRFADKNGLSRYDYVMHPRTTGFVHMVQKMRKLGYIKYIYDVTIGFGENIVQSEVDLAAHGSCPSDVQYQVEKFAIESLPSDDEGLIRWINDLWAKKELKLKEFYSKVGEDRKFPDSDTTEKSEYQSTTMASCVQWFVLFLWVFSTVFWIYAFFELPFMMILTFISVLVFSLIQVFYGGVDTLAIHQSCRTSPAPLPAHGPMESVSVTSQSE